MPSFIGTVTRFCGLKSLLLINVGSGMGSLALTGDPERVESKVIAPLYTASKAAVTILAAQYAKALHGIRFNAADPGSPLPT